MIKMIDYLKLLCREMGEDAGLRLRLERFLVDMARRIRTDSEPVPLKYNGPGNTRSPFADSCKARAPPAAGGGSPQSA